jgi:large subunit ribosomal protein L17
MRHNKEGRKLGRTASHRKALLSSLSTALIKHKKIMTTTAKAKETRRIIEPLITRARDAYQAEKSGQPVNVHARRETYRLIRDRDAVNILFTEIAEKVGKRPGGYTRVLKLGNRKGDSAEMSVIELVDYNEAQDLKKRRQRVERSKAAAERRRKDTGEAVKETAEKPKKAKAAPAPADVIEEPAAQQAEAPVEPVAEAVEPAVEETAKEEPGTTEETPA